MDKTKDRIRDIVKTYEIVCAGEFSEFKLAMSIKRDLQKSKFSELKGTDMVERLMYEVPEQLFLLFKGILKDEEKGFLQSKKGAIWFAKTFPQYRVAEKV